MSEAKKSYLKRLGYSDERIKQLEREAKSTKDKQPNRIMELVYKQLAEGTPAKPNRITELISGRLTKQNEQPPGQPNIWDLIAPPADAPPTVSPHINGLISRSQAGHPN